MGLTALGRTVVLGLASATIAAGTLVPTAAGAATGCPAGSPLAAAPTRTPSHSAAAITALGQGVEGAASRTGRGSAAFSRQLVEDPSLWVDRCGNPFFVEPVAPTVSTAAPAAAATPDAAAAAVPSIPAADAFTLHSLPGALRTIYLDFGGERVADTGWNPDYHPDTWDAPAFDTDSDPSTFSTAERNFVIEVWRRVADDYAPFAVDVTTEDPGDAALVRANAADQRYGSRALISPDPNMAVCRCGGIAYVGTFNLPDNAYYQPAWVLPQNLAWKAKNVAEAASHEVGHNLGLSHDGAVAHGTTAAVGYYAGSAGWAPIMGVGYYQNITQWSRGEYPYANNTEDDLTVIVNHGAPRRADDVGDAPATATPLALAAPTNARLTTAGDVDWYSVTAVGTVTVAAAPTNNSPNVDLGLSLADATGTVLTSDAPAYLASQWPASSSASVTYFVPTPTDLRIRVEGTGNGVPGSDGATDYASLGEYQLVVDSALGLPAAPDTLTQGQAVSFDLAAAGGTGPYSYTMTGSLPPGLSRTGSQFSGTPTTVGSYSATLKVTDAADDSASVRLALTVVPALTVTTPDSTAGTVGNPLGLPLTASGGVPPLSWQATGLPAGLAVSGQTISGTPTAAGSVTATLTVSDANGVTAIRDLVLDIAPELQITSADAVATTATATLYQSLTSTGGAAPIRWRVASGSLPSGVTMSGATVSGQPTTPGRYPVSIAATDANGAMTTQSLAITVVAAPTITTTNPPTWTVGGPITLALTATDGTAPLTWSLTAAGDLPPGTTLTGAALTGTPTTPGFYDITTQVTDANHVSATRTLQLVVIPAPQITTAGPVNLTVGVTMGLQLQATGGVAPRAWSVAGLPPGLALGSDRITGSPTQAGSFPVTLTTTDNNLASTSRQILFTVTAAQPDPSQSPTPGDQPSAQPVDQPGDSMSTPPTGSAGVGGASETNTGGAPAAAPPNPATSSNITVASNPVGLSLPAVTSIGPWRVKAKVKVSLTASGGTAKYTWKRVTGKLPKGMKLSKAGTLSGKPKKKGTFTITVRVTDARRATATGRVVMVVN